MYLLKPNRTEFAIQNISEEHIGYPIVNNFFIEYFRHGHNHGEVPENDSCLGDGLCTGLGQVRTVAWVIVVGDGFCNIVDGLTSAAAFSVSISKGISVMIAVYLQELPHRIGDYAVFVNAGMTPFQVNQIF